MSDDYCLYGEMVSNTPQENRPSCWTCRYNEWDNISSICDDCVIRDDGPTNYKSMAGLQLFADILFDKEKSEQFLKE